MGVSHLYDLQQVDSAIGRAVAVRAGLSDGTAERAAVAGATERLKEIRHQLATRQTHLRDLELAIQSVQAKRARVEADLYSGRINNPKELASMQDELTLLGRTKARSEDELLALLDEVERLEPQERDGMGILGAADAALARQMAASRQAADAVEKEIADLMARRTALTDGLEEDLVRRYDRLRERKGGVAVVAVRGGICEGCHVGIPERLLRRLEEEPETRAACDGCGRWLFVPR